MTSIFEGRGHPKESRTSNQNNGHIGFYIGITKKEKRWIRNVNTLPSLLGSPKKKAGDSPEKKTPKEKVASF